MSRSEPSGSQPASPRSSVPPLTVNPCPPLPGCTVAAARIPPLSENVLSTSAVVPTVKVPAVICSAASLTSDWIVMLVAEVIVSEANAGGIYASSDGPGSLPPTQFVAVSKLVPVPEVPPFQVTMESSLRSSNASKRSPRKF